MAYMGILLLVCANTLAHPLLRQCEAGHMPRDLFGPDAAGNRNVYQSCNFLSPKDFCTGIGTYLRIL
jgi:hypothetical protein